MEHRTLGRTGRTVSVVGLGTWQLGADWGDVPEEQALEVLQVAVEEGVTFLDTADVYGDRKSTRLNSSHANISYAVFCLKKKKAMTHVLGGANEGPCTRHLGR